MAEILIVDDERTLRNGMRALLEGEGYAVRTARDGEEALGKISERRPDLVLLDVMMPKLNGFRTCAEIRRTDALLPIVFLTAKDSEGDLVRGMGLGGDDYVSKEAGDAVLLARIGRALERIRNLSAAAAQEGRALIRVETVTVDMKSLTVSDAGGEIGRLTPTEANILKLLASARGRPFTTDDIIDSLRGEGFACEDTMVYVHVSNLRRKLGAASSLLTSRYGVGYTLVK